MVTAPLAAVFLAVSAEMVLLAVAATTTWRLVFGFIASLAGLLALAMVRESITRLRGKRQIVIGARELIMPGMDRATRGATVSFRDIRKLELTGPRGFNRVLKINHANGDLEISGVMLGSVGELDEIHGLLKAARKTR